jgi:hypothetical protein
VVERAADAGAVLAALQAAPASARERARAAGTPLPVDGPVLMDINTPIVDAHSDKQGAQPTYERGLGFAPMLTPGDHGQSTGPSSCEPLTGLTASVI